MKKIEFGLFVLLIIVFQGCGSSSKKGRFQRGKRKDPGTSVETMTVSQQNISQEVQSYGTIKSRDVVQVTPQVNNRITKIYADLGDTVNQGQPLAKIYSASMQDQVQQAQAQVQQNRAAFKRDSANYFRQKKLFKRELISKATLDQAEATYESAKSQLESGKSSLTQQQENFKNTVIRSPVYGVVLTRNVSQGDLASSGQVAFEIGNLTGYETRVHLPLDEWKKVRVGQKVNFELSGGEKSSATGRVARTSPRLDPATGLGEVVIAFTHKGPSIYQGALVKSIINVETHKNAVVIPRSALVENVQTLIQPESNTIQTRQTYAAFMVQGDSVALKRKLKLGIEQGEQVEVVSGLRPGDEVVITGQEGLKDSSKVHIVKENPFKNDSSVPLNNSESPVDSSSANSNK